jgi:hypothetical protein
MNWRAARLAGRPTLDHRHDTCAQVGSSGFFILSQSGDRTLAVRGSLTSPGPNAQTTFAKYPRLAVR